MSDIDGKGRVTVKSELKESEVQNGKTLCIWC